MRLSGRRVGVFLEANVNGVVPIPQYDGSKWSSTNKMLANGYADMLIAEAEGTHSIYCVLIGNNLAGVYASDEAMRIHVRDGSADPKTLQNIWEVKPRSKYNTGGRQLCSQMMAARDADGLKPHGRYYYIIWLRIYYL